MQIKDFKTQATALIAIFVTLPLAYAADCADVGTGTNCESRESMFSFRAAFCGTDQWRTTGRRSWNNANLNLIGNFGSQQLCWDSFENIINQCYGKHAVGSWLFDTFRLEVKFCRN